MKNLRKEKGFVFTVTEATGKDICGGVRPVRVLADLQAEIADIILYETCSKVGEDVLVAGGGLSPFGDLLQQRRRQVELVMIKRMETPIHHFLPIVVFGDTYEREGAEPRGGVPVIDVVS